jgi:phosphopentomutase
MGVLTETAMPTYADGFPDDVIAAFAEATGRGVIGNVPASGTAIIEQLGEEHQRTGKWIVYTSADSVFQIAAHEQTVPLSELYAACEIARAQLQGPHAVGRVIARPFDGEPGAYRRTSHRHDYSLEPSRPNHLTRICEAGLPVVGVGKIADVFAGRDVAQSEPTGSNAEGIAAIERLLGEVESGFIFANLVETDMLFGHRNDPAGFYGSLQQFDRALPALVAQLRPDDLLILTSDHGCDPTTASTDHSREHALLVAHRPGQGPGPRHDGWFPDVGATVADWLGAHDAALPGTPFRW